MYEEKHCKMNTFLWRLYRIMELIILRKQRFSRRVYTSSWMNFQVSSPIWVQGRGHCCYLGKIVLGGLVERLYNSLSNPSHCCCCVPAAAAVTSKTTVSSSLSLSLSLSLSPTVYFSLSLSFFSHSHIYAQLATRRRLGHSSICNSIQTHREFQYSPRLVFSTYVNIADSLALCHGAGCRDETEQRRCTATRR